MEVSIPAGTFEMGSDAESDNPRHLVTLTRAYWMDEHDVTIGQYRKVLGPVPEGQPESGDEYPVTQVTWDEAAAYCGKVGGRLPTEAEWERAARGPRNLSPYPWGKEEPCADDTCRANFGGDEDGFAKTSPVCRFGRNESGLCDMAGNVWQWVSDRYDEGYTRGTQTDPAGPASGDQKVLRGGSWYHSVAVLRSTHRFHFRPELRFNNFGFRCVRGAV